MSERISRRRAIKSVFLGLGAAALAGGGYEGFRRYERDKALEWLTSPDEFLFQIAGIPPSKALCGVYINAPFLYLANQEDIDHHLVTIDKPWIKGLRVFLNDEFEPTLGDYDTNVLNRVVKIAHALEHKGKMIQVDLFDGYTMNQTWNPIFGGHDATSPYVKNGPNHLYTDPHLADAFRTRISAAAQSLKNLSNLSSVSVANELHPPAGPDGSALFRMWYQMAVDTIRSDFPNTSVISGVGDPRTLENITGLAATTVHVYPWTDTLTWISDYARLSPIPIVFQECGAAYSLFDIHSPLSNDALVSDYLKDLLHQTSWVDPQTKIVTLSATSLYPWKLDTYVDGFSFNPQEDRQTSALLETFSGIVEQVAA